MERRGMESKAIPVGKTGSRKNRRDEQLKTRNKYRAEVSILESSEKLIRNNGATRV